MEARSPTSLLSLPDDLLDLIVLGTLKDSCVVRHDRYCSGLAGTCRRLWGLHQYPTSRISDTCHEQRPKMVEGIPWCLERLRSARSLAMCVDMESSDGASKPVLSSRAHPPTPATFPNLQLLGMSFKDTQYELQFQPCMRALLQGATNLKALRLHPHGTDSMSLLSSCSLKHLELHIPSKAFTGAWRGQFPDLRACLMLESLKVSTTIHDEDYSYFVPLPGLRLRYMSKLRHIELEEQTLPWHCLELPPGCQLFVRLSQPLHEIFCGNAGELVCKQTRVMWLREWYTSWQTDLARFQHLQLLVMEVDKCSQSPPLDLAKLQHIPHVRLLSKHPVSLVLTEGSWQSLEILGERGVHATFSDVDAFVTRTKLFSFCCSDTFFLSDFRRGATSRKSPAMMMERLQAACSKHSVECYTTSHNDRSWPFTVKVTRLSNRKLKPPFDKGEEPSCPESVFMQLARTHTLVSHEDFWPQDSCKALDCA